MSTNDLQNPTLYLVTCDLDRAAPKLKLVRDIVATANSGGGRIVVGRDEEPAGAAPSGLGPDNAKSFGDEELSRLVNSFIAPDRLELRSFTDESSDGRFIVTIEVPAIVEPPLVLAKAGIDETGRHDGKPVFEVHSVLVRRGRRVEQARHGDYRRWTAEAKARTRAEFVDRVSMVVSAPADATVRVVDQQEVRDEPTFLLSRATDVFRHRPEQLLSGDDLAYLWLHRHAIDLNPVAKELLFQSALRKRATLYLWLSILDLSAAQVRALLFRAIDMKDRDKSDAAPSILMVAALYLSEEDYDNLATALSQSSYTHMREAVEAMPNLSDAVTALASHTSAAGDGQLSLTGAVTDLLAEADRLLESASTRTPRRLPTIGLQILRHRMNHN